MAFERDTLATLINRIDADIAANLPNYVVGLRQSVERVLAQALGGVVHGLHGHLVYLSKQIFPDTAEGEYLERIAGVYGIERIEGARATGTLSITTTVSGVVVPAGTIWTSGDGIRFSQNANITVTNSIGGGQYRATSVAVTAVEKGVSGNISVSTGLSLESPLAGVLETASSVTTSGGSDDETDAALLSRLLLRLRNTPRGGAEADYESWALEVPGVTRAWAISRQYGVGTVGVAFVRDNDGSGTAIVPDGSEVTAVQAYIDARAPATADARVFAPTAVLITFTIQLPSTAATDAIKAAITTSLDDYFARESAPGATLFISQIREAISSATGEVNHLLPTVGIGGTGHTPPIDIEIGSEEIAIRSTITWGTIT